jgi:hypothetical protein
VTYGGFSLGSGVKGDGGLRDLGYGDTTYNFTSEAAAPTTTPADVTGYSTMSRPSALAVRLNLYSNALKANQTEGKTLTWTVYVDGSHALVVHQHASAHAIFNRAFTQHTNMHTVTLYKNGQLVRTTNVRTK